MTFEAFCYYCTHAKWPVRMLKRRRARLALLSQQNALEALPNHLAYWKLKETEKDFIPYPASWLRAYRFEDELDMEVKKLKKPELPWYSTEELTIKKAQEVNCQLIRVKDGNNGGLGLAKRLSRLRSKCET